MKRLKPPWKKVTWDRTPLGLETVPPDRPRAALAVASTERRWNLKFWGEGPALHREAERDTTGSFYTVSPRYIRGLAAACKGTVFGRQHACVIRFHRVKVRLTVRF